MPAKKIKDEDLPFPLKSPYAALNAVAAAVIVYFKPYFLCVG